MTHLLYEIACNPNLELEIRYEIARYLQKQRMDDREREKRRRLHVRRQLKQLRMNA